MKRNFVCLSYFIADTKATSYFQTVYHHLVFSIFVMTTDEYFPVISHLPSCVANYV